MQRSYCKSPLWVAQMLGHWASVYQMPVQASPHIHNPLFNLSGLHFTSLCGHWLFSVVYEWRKDRKWGSSPAVSCAVNSQQLCGIFQLKHWTPVLHLRLIFIPLICNSVTNSPSLCHARLHCTPQAPLLSPPAGPHNSPTAKPPTLHSSPAVLCRSPVTL